MASEWVLVRILGRLARANDAKDRTIVKRAVGRGRNTAAVGDHPLTAANRGSLGRVPLFDRLQRCFRGGDIHWRGVDI